MKNQQRYIPIEEVIAGGPLKIADAKLEKLNRARLDALGYMMQASHWLDEAAEGAKAAVAKLTKAEKLLRRREAALEKADRAFLGLREEGRPQVSALATPINLWGKIYNEREVCESAEHRLAEYKKALRIMDVPVHESLSDDEKFWEEDPPTLCRVRFFLMGSVQTFYAAAWDGGDRCWGIYVQERGPVTMCGFTHASLTELSQITGALGLGIEVDTSFQPALLHEVITRESKP